MTCFKPIKAKKIRLVRLDTCGNAVTGATGMIVSDGFVSVEFSPQYEEGDEFLIKNGNGDLCVNEKDPDRLKRVDLTITLCEVDPAAIEMMTGARLITRTGDPVGFGLSEAPNTAGYALELWNDLGGDVCAGDVTTQWFHWVLPFVRNGRFGGITHEYGPIAFEVTANSKPNANYGAGPHGLWTPDIPADEHVAAQSTTTAPPDADCGYLNLIAA